MLDDMPHHDEVLAGRRALNVCNRGPLDATRNERDCFGGRGSRGLGAGDPGAPIGERSQQRSLSCAELELALARELA